MANVNLPFKRYFYSSNPTALANCQDQVHNEAALEILIGRIFSSPSSLYCDVAPFSQNAVFTATLIKSQQIISSNSRSLLWERNGCTQWWLVTSMRLFYSHPWLE